MPFVCACGSCAACLAGEQQVCERQRQPGFTDDGSFAEFVAIHHADVNLVRLPDGMSPVTAAGLGLPVRDRLPGASPCTAGSGRGTGSRCTAAVASGCRRS